MKPSRWSRVDLNRQKLAVHRIAGRAEVERVRFSEARERCAAQLGRLFGGPAGLPACFIAGVAVGGLRPRGAAKVGKPSRLRRSSAFAVSVCEALLLHALKSRRLAEQTVTNAPRETTRASSQTMTATQRQA